MRKELAYFSVYDFSCFQLCIIYFVQNAFNLRISVFLFNQVFYKDDDITRGKENVPVSCVNSLSNDPPPYVEYSAERFPGEGVFLNLDEDFLCGCDCTDNCQVTI